MELEKNLINCNLKDVKDILEKQRKMNNKQWFLFTCLVFLIFIGHTCILHSKMSKEREQIQEERNEYKASSKAMMDTINSMRELRGLQEYWKDKLFVK